MRKVMKYIRSYKIISKYPKFGLKIIYVENIGIIQVSAFDISFSAIKIICQSLLPFCCKRIYNQLSYAMQLNMKEDYKNVNKREIVGKIQYKSAMWVNKCN